METVKIKTEGRYQNHSVKQNKSIDLQFKMPYTELTNYIQTIQMLNENVTVGGKIGTDKKPKKFGTFMINNVKIDNDGEGTIKFNSQLDFVDLESINDLAVRNDEPLTVLLKASIDVEEESEEDDESEEDEEDNDE